MFLLTGLILDYCDDEVGIEGTEADLCCDSEEVCSAGGVEGSAIESVEGCGCEFPARVGGIELRVEGCSARFFYDSIFDALIFTAQRMLCQCEVVGSGGAGSVSVCDFITDETKY